jgi:hypothetical protein
LIVTVADADLVVSATEVAFTVAVDMFATVAGAVYKPLEETVPPPVNDHVTAVLELPVTVAVNCCVPPPISVAVVGETDTFTPFVLVTTRAS